MDQSAAEALIRKTESYDQYYDVQNELGRGRFAVVKKCVCQKTGKSFAAKIIKKSRSNSHGRSGREQLLLEIDILNKSTHPKMVRLYDVFETRAEMQLILEYAQGGDLHRHCIEADVTRTEKEICYLIRQIVEAVRYLHDQQIVHLDLKPDNILLAKQCEIFPEIKLIDFGLSRRLNVPYSQFDIVGTPEYVAPEVLAYEPIDYGSDMWSVGVVTYVLLSGISPFAGDDVMETYSNIGMVDYDFDCEEFDEISDAAIDFIETLLVRAPKKRMSAREALEHDWLKQLEGGITAADVMSAQQAQQEHPDQDITISPLVDEEYPSSSESETPLEKSLEFIDKNEDSASNDADAFVNGENDDSEPEKTSEEESTAEETPTDLSDEINELPIEEKTVEEDVHDNETEGQKIEQEVVSQKHEESIVDTVVVKNNEIADKQGDSAQSEVEKEESIPKIKSSEPEVKKEEIIPKIKSSEPEVKKEDIIPKIKSIEPEVKPSVSEVKSSKLEVESSEPESNGKSKADVTQNANTPETKHEIVRSTANKVENTLEIHENKSSTKSESHDEDKYEEAEPPSKKSFSRSKSHDEASVDKSVRKPKTPPTLSKVGALERRKQALELALKADSLKGARTPSRFERSASSKSSSSGSTPSRTPSLVDSPTKSPGTPTRAESTSKMSGRLSKIESNSSSNKASPGASRKMASPVPRRVESPIAGTSDDQELNTLVSTSPAIACKDDSTRTEKAPNGRSVRTPTPTGDASPKVSTRASVRQKIPGGIAAKMANKFASPAELSVGRISPKLPLKIEKKSDTDKKVGEAKESITDQKQPPKASSLKRQSSTENKSSKVNTENKGKEQTPQVTTKPPKSPSLKRDKEDSPVIKKRGNKTESAKSDEKGEQMSESPANKRKGKSDASSSDKENHAVENGVEAVNENQPSAPKPRKDIKVSMTLSGSRSASGKKLTVGPLISIANNENDKTKDNESDSDKKEGTENENNSDTPMQIQMSSGGSIKMKLGVGRPQKKKSEEDLFNQENTEDCSKRAPKLRELRGKSQSLSRRRANTTEGSPNSPRKNYRRLYVTKVRNSKIFDPDFNIMNSEAAKIMQRVDNDVLQVELRLKSTDLKLLP